MHVINECEIEECFYIWDCWYRSPTFLEAIRIFYIKLLQASSAWSEKLDVGLFGRENEGGTHL
jgi:hypothetical protein